MKHKLFLFGVLLFSASLTHAQYGDIEVHKDNRIDALVAKQSEIIPPSVKPQVDGWRIQLFFDSDRGKVNAARSQFIARFPKVDTYVKYDAPNYFLKVGDFRTRLEAEKVKSEVEANFPTSFVVKDKINLPRLEKIEGNN